MESSKPTEKTIVITGPTASGKTGLCVDIASAWNAEIISADSRQVYRGLDVGTAKPTRDELSTAPHHLIDIRDVGERFTAADFRDNCLAAFENIRAWGKTPVIAGGTPMYLHALLHGFDFGRADRDPELRAELEDRIRAEGTAALHSELERADPDAAARIGVNDARRIVRALELFAMTGRATAKLSKDGNPVAQMFPAAVFVLYVPREILYRRINKRAADMYNIGIVEETERALRDHGEAARSFLRGIIGYSQALELLDGRMTVAEAVERTQRDTRHFARRQMIWFRKMRPAIWLNADIVGREGLLPLIEIQKSGPLN